MARLRKRTAKKEPTQEQQQPYDNVLKLLLDKQEAVMLPNFLAECEYLEVLDIEVIRPPLRVGRVYKVRYRGQLHILHLEFESGPNRKMGSRLLVYNAYFLDKFELPVISIIVYPFETTMAESPLEVMSGQKALLTFHFRVMPLWKLNVRQYLDAHMVSMYGLLPTMQGANLEVLSQAIDEMQAHYKSDDTKLRRELLCFRTLLRRAEMVPLEDKHQIQERLEMFNSLLDEDPYIQEKKAEGRAEGFAKGLAEGEARGEAKGEAKGLQEAVITIIEGRFPSLLQLARERVKRVKKPDALRLLLKRVDAAPNEDTVRLLLELIAA